MNIRITGVEVIAATCIAMALLFTQPLPVALSFYMVFLGTIAYLLLKGGKATYSLMGEIYKQTSLNQTSIKLIKRRQRKIMATLVTEEPESPTIKEESSNDK